MKYMLSVGDPRLASTRSKRFWKVGEETSQYTGDTFVSVEEGPLKPGQKPSRKPFRNEKPDAVGHTNIR